MMTLLKLFPAIAILLMSSAAIVLTLPAPLYA